MLRAAEGRVSELMKRRDWEQQEGLHSHKLGLLSVADTRRSFCGLKHQDNLSSSHRGHPLPQIIHSLQISNLSSTLSPTKRSVACKFLNTVKGLPVGFLNVHSRRRNAFRTVKSPGAQVSSLLSSALYIMERNPAALEALC